MSTLSTAMSDAHEAPRTAANCTAGVPRPDTIACCHLPSALCSPETDQTMRLSAAKRASAPMPEPFMWYWNATLSTIGVSPVQTRPSYARRKTSPVRAGREASA